MSAKKKLINFFIKPPIWFDAIIWAVSLFALASGIGIACTPYRGELLALVLYAVAVFFVVASIYLLLTFGDIPEKISKNERAKRFVSDFGFRTYVMTICSLLLNTAYATFGTLIAVLSRSLWLGALVWYHVLLALARALIMFYLKRHRGQPDFEKHKLRAYVLGGIALMVIALAIIPVSILIVKGENRYSFFGGAVVYSCALALYTVIKVVSSFVTQSKAKKSGDPALLAVKSISVSTALISIFLLQALMLTAFENFTFGTVMNPVVGGVVSAIILAMGINMIVRGVRRLNVGEEYGASEEVEIEAAQE